MDAIADTGLREIMLGAFGSKISVDSQIATRWKALGESFDNTWGFSEANDLSSFDEDPPWESTQQFFGAKRRGSKLPEYWTPTQSVVTTYSKADLKLFQKDFQDFPEGAHNGKTPQQILKESEYDHGRIPMGLLMMAGYGMSNAIVEIDTAVETFDYNQYDIVERCKFLIQWCQEHLRKRNTTVSADSHDGGDKQQQAKLDTLACSLI